MPIYNFACSDCFKKERKLLQPTETKGQTCKECSGELVREAKAPSTQVMETIDNGLMPRKVERLKDTVELFRDRAKANKVNRPKE